MDREAWHVAVHGVAKSRTWLNYWTERNGTEQSETGSCFIWSGYAPSEIVGPTARVSEGDTLSGGERLGFYKFSKMVFSPGTDGKHRMQASLCSCLLLLWSFLRLQALRNPCRAGSPVSPLLHKQEQGSWLPHNTGDPESSSPAPLEHHPFWEYRLPPMAWEASSLKPEGPSAAPAKLRPGPRPRPAF